MRSSWVLLLVSLGSAGCLDKSPTNDTTDSTDSGDTSAPDDTDTTLCPTGPGEVEGYLLGSDDKPLGSGKVRLFDSTGSEEYLDNDVKSDGTYRLVFGKGNYVVRGEYGTCVGEDIPVAICGEQTVNLNITLTCAP